MLGQSPLNLALEAPLPVEELLGKFLFSPGSSKKPRHISVPTPLLLYTISPCHNRNNYFGYNPLCGPFQDQISISQNLHLLLAITSPSYSLSFLQSQLANIQQPRFEKHSTYGHHCRTADTPSGTVHMCSLSTTIT